MFSKLKRTPAAARAPGESGIAALLLANRDFLALWLGQSISALGDWIAFVGLMVLVYDLTHSVAATALLRIGHAVPILLVAPVAGVFVDRWNRQATLVLTNALSAGLVLLYAAFPRLLPLVLTHTALTIVLTFFTPARAAVVPQLVPAEQLVAANALIGLTNTLAVIVGSAVGGVLVAWLGPAVTFYLDAASFMVAAAAVGIMHLPSTDGQVAMGSRASIHSVWDQLHEGLVYLREATMVRAVVTLALVFAGAPAMVVTLGVAFAESTLRAGAAGYGILVAATGIGALVGALALLAVGARLPAGRSLGYGGVLMGGGIVALGLSRALVLGAIFYGIGGVGTAITDVAVSSLLGRLVPPALRGRIFSLLYTLQHVSVLGGSAAVGLLASVWGAWPLIVMAGIVAALGGLSGLRGIGDAGARD